MASMTARNICADCVRRPPAFDATFCAADYTPPVDQLVLALKFGGQLALAPVFAHMLVDAALHREPHDPGPTLLPDMLCPVPLGRERLAGRGYNQALEIARPLSRSLGIALEPRLLLRVRETEAQSGLAAGDRRHNLNNAFVVSPEAVGRVCGSHVGVVDDVMTTGETLHELAGTLKRFGAAKVSNFVFARTPPHARP